MGRTTPGGSPPYGPRPHGPRPREPRAGDGWSPDLRRFGRPHYLAIVEAIDHLSPNGDAAASAALEKVVDADKAAGVNYANDEVFKTALKLRSRVP